jgi:hypothetical protein
MKVDKTNLVKIRVLPGHGIGGVGYQNQEVSLNPTEAAHWVNEGYAVYVDPEETAVVEPTTQEPENPESED